MLGEKLEKIINIENGRTKLDLRFSDKVKAATGVDTFSYLWGNDIPLEFAGRRAYTKADYELWKNMHDTSESSIEEFSEKAKSDLIGMMNAARRAGSPKNQLTNLQVSFYQWRDDTIKNFQLQKFLDEK